MSIVSVFLMKNEIIILFDIDNTLFDTEKLKQTDLSTFELYDEVNDMLAKLAKIATLGIFSQGDIAFQNKKLNKTNIQHYFSDEHKHIVEYKLAVMEEVLQKYKNKAKVYYIDDWLEMLQKAKQVDPSVFTIWMKRGEYASVQQAKDDFSPDAVVETVRDIIPLIAQQ